MQINSLPYYESFENPEDYQAMLWPNFTEFSQTPGWGGGQALKMLVQAYSHEASSGLGALYFPHTEQWNMRWLVKYLPSYFQCVSEEEWKALIVRRSTFSSDRLMILDYHYNQEGPERTLRPSHNIDPEPYPMPGVPEFKLEHWQNQWLCLEVEFNRLTGNLDLYITTQDGTYNDTLAYRKAGCGNLPVDSIDVFYGYWERPQCELEIHLDHMVFDTRHVGPPDGFVAGAPENGFLPVSVLHWQAAPTFQEVGWYNVLLTDLDTGAEDSLEVYHTYMRLSEHPGLNFVPGHQVEVKVRAVRAGEYGPYSTPITLTAVDVPPLSPGLTEVLGLVGV